MLIGVTGVNLSFTLISAKMYIVGPVMLVIGILCLFLLAMHENKFANPVLPMKILKNPVMEYAIIYILVYYVSSGINYLVPQNFEKYGKSSSLAGTITMMISLGGITISFLMPVLAKHFIEKHIMVFALSIQVTMIFTSIFLVEILPAYTITVIIALIMNQVMDQLVFAIMMVVVPYKYTAQVSAIPTTCRTIG